MDDLYNLSLAHVVAARCCPEHEKEAQVQVDSFLDHLELKYGRPFASAMVLQVFSRIWAESKTKLPKA